jgi:GNAT superfamily N-acetyltransferase
MISIRQDANPSTADRERVLVGLSAVNSERTGVDATRVPVSIFARDAQGLVVGGLIGFQRWRWLQIEFLWVATTHRRRGIGGGLLHVAEENARRAGCCRVILDTHSFQARPFYEQRGYGVVGTVPDFPVGHAWFVMVKSIG